MPDAIDPKLFGLHPATRLEQSGQKRFVIVINRKSRIIMKDGEKIVQKAARIRAKVPGAAIGLRSSAPVCSKTKALLRLNNVEIVE
jgi:hypothetical protein